MVPPRPSGLPADLHPGVDIDDGIQLRRQPDDHIVVWMAAKDSTGIAAVVLDADARPLADPLLNFVTTFDRLRRIDGDQSGYPVRVLFQVFAKLALIVGRKRCSQ